MRIHLFLWHAGHGRIDLQYKYIHFSFQHLPSTCLWGLYVQKYRDTFIEVLHCDLAERFGHLVFSPVLIFQPSSTTSPSSRFTIFWILHYQLQFRDYGGSLAHRFQLRFTLFQLECTCLVLLDLSACTFLPSDITPFPGSWSYQGPPGDHGHSCELRFSFVCHSAPKREIRGLTLIFSPLVCRFLLFFGRSIPSGPVLGVY
jgi:hypothetical protein